MLCPNCNQPVKDGEAFCGSCGTAITAETAPAEAVAVSETAPATEAASAGNFELNTGEEKPAKKRFKIKKSFIIIAAAVVLVVVILLNLSSIIGFGMKTFASPEKYLTYVELTSLKDSSDSILAAYNNYKKNFSASSGSSVDFTVSVGDNAIALIETLIAAQGSGMGDLDLDFLKEIGISTDTVFKDNKMSIGLTAKISGKEVLEGRVYMDYDNGVMYVGLPELHDQYLKYEIPQSEMADMDIAMEDMEKFYSALEEALPSSKQVKKCLEKYAKAALGAIDDVTKEKVTVSVGDIDQKVTKLTLNLNEEMFNDIEVAVIEEIIADKDLKNIIEDIEEAFNKELQLVDEDIYDSMIESLYDELEYVKERKESGYVSDEVVGQIVTYVNGKSEIVGRSFISEGYNGEDEEVSYLMVKKGSNFNYELKTPNDAFYVTGSGKETSSKLNGEFDIYVDGKELATITIEDFNTKQFDKGNLKGTITIVPGSNFFEIFDMDESLAAATSMTKVALRFSFDVTAKSADVSVSLLMNNENFLSINCSSEITKSKDVNLPENAIDEEYADQWAEDIDYDKLISDLEEAGLPNMLTEALEELMAPSGYFSY